jgi:uncharacterized protein (DUF58 family)
MTYTFPVSTETAPMTPRPRLVIYLLITIPVLVTLVALFPALSVCLNLMIVLVLAMPAIDFSLGYLKKPICHFESDTVIHGVVGRQIDFQLTLAKPVITKANIRVGIPFPTDFQTESAIQSIPLIEGCEHQNISFLITISKRGAFKVTELFWDYRSLFGFWIRRFEEKIQCELRIHHDLTHCSKETLRFLIHRDPGARLHRQLGRGREFEKLREYQCGDDFLDIHWKATAKRQYPITKIYRAEQAQQVYIAIDSSRLSRRPVATDTGQVQTALERSIVSTLLLCMAVERQGDQFGLITFSDKVDHMIATRRGLSHFSHCRDHLLQLQPTPVPPDFTEISSQIAQSIRRRALMIFLTSLDDPVVAEDFIRSIGMITRKHLVIAVMIVPAEIRQLFTGPPVTHSDEIYDRLGSHLRWTRLLQVQRELQQKGIHFLLFPHDQAEIRLIGEYLNIKQKQAI